jgi:hypothetical protein
MLRGTYASGLASALHAAGLPYGYTVTVWSSGQVLIDLHGTPAIWLVLLYAAGAVTAYGTLKWATKDIEPSSSQLAASPHVVRAGAVHVAAIAAAIGASVVIGLSPEGLAFPLTGFAVTVVYLGGASLELGLRERETPGAAG